MTLSAADTEVKDAIVKEIAPVLEEITKAVRLIADRVGERLTAVETKIDALTALVKDMHPAPAATPAPAVPEPSSVEKVTTLADDVGKSLGI